MTFTNNAEFQSRVSAVIKSDGAWHVTDPDLDTDPDAYNEFSALGCDICHGGAGSVFTCIINTSDVNCECDICSDCRYALEYGIDEN